MSSSRREEEGHQLMAQAEKKISSSGGFFRSVLGIFTRNKEEAAETFVRAANCFKLAKAWTKAGSALERAASTYESMSDMKYEAASKYSDAGKAYKNSDVNKAIGAYQKAITLYTDAARFQQCGRLQKEVAQMQEDIIDNASALKSYTAATDFYEMDGSKSNANSMRIKVAMLTASAGKYAEAADLYETIADVSLSNNILKYSAREHLLRAGLCRLSLSDIIGTQRALEKYATMDPTFLTSREGKLLESITSAVDQGDAEAFTNHVFQYDSLSKIDAWKTSILLKIKNSIKAETDDLT